MPDRPDWTYGTILISPRRKSRRVMFLGWDARGSRAFTAMALDTRATFADEVGTIFTASGAEGWAATSSRDEISDALRQMSMRQIREVFERLFAGDAT